MYWQWGLAVLLLGAGTTLFGVLFALMQHDLKRLLAYHSVENIGIILLGLGMSLVFFGFGHPAAGAWGSSQRSTTRSTTRYSRAALPGRRLDPARDRAARSEPHGRPRAQHARHRIPFPRRRARHLGAAASDGFVSEWLTFRRAAGALLEHSVVRSLVPLFAATLALAGALTAMCFEGLRRGIPRTAAQQGQGVRGRRPERAPGLAWLSAGCLVPGLFPAGMLQMLNQVGASLTGHGLPAQALESSNWLWLVPTHPAEASYSPLIFFVVVLAVVLLTVRLVRIFYHGRVRRADPWDCGFPEQTTRMQDTADAFGQPIGLVFGPLYLMKRSLPGPEEATPKYSMKVADRLAMAVSASRTRGRVRLGEDRAAAARPHQHLPAVQLPHADRAPRVRAMNVALQLLLQSALVVLVAPLVLGWVNICRAWLQNRSAPSVLLPYYTLAKLFHKDAVIANTTSPVFRLTPYVLFGCMALAAGIVPVLATDLPFAPAADIIALVGLFATARVFAALAAMDTGTSFGGLGARREMLVGFLAEPAILMTLFTAAFISGSTSCRRSSTPSRTGSSRSTPASRSPRWRS